MSKKIRVAVAGGTGYMGVESLRLLLGHPGVEVRRVTSEQYAGRSLDEVYPAFRGRARLTLEPLDAASVGEGVDVVVAALPHGASAASVVKALASGARVVDLSADFRLRDADLFRLWYGDHPAPELLSEAVYGIPEFSRPRIASARLVAAPGCYPTGALFGLLPLVRAGLTAGGAIIVDAKSGASGAGRAAKTELLFSELDENVRAYAVGKHRHLPEITQELAAAGCKSPVVFTPHLLPLRRGILSTIYVPVRPGTDLRAAYEAAYATESFVQILPSGSFPEVRDVRGTNNVQIGWTVLEAENLAIVVTAIDNLGKGGAGQAIQCLNAMFGLDERTGLDQIAAVP